MHQQGGRAYETTTNKPASAATAFTLGGPKTGFRGFVAAIGNAKKCAYIAQKVDGSGTPTGAWELAEGTVTDAAPDTLSRGKLIASSTGSFIDWSATGEDASPDVFQVEVARSRGLIISSATSVTLNEGDDGAIVKLQASAAVTLNLPDADGPDGWQITVCNELTGAENAGQVTLDPAGSDQIDGQTTSVTYPGDIRIITREGGAYYSTLIRGGYVEYTTAGASTYTKPTGSATHDVDLWGAGGGGGSGRRGAAGTARAGGHGGSGGAYVTRQIRSSDLGSTVTVTVGTGGSGGAAVTADNTSGNAGSGGGNSTFGSLLTAYGGGGGLGGTAANQAGGGGGGSLGAGSTTAGGQPTSGQNFAGHFGGCHPGSGSPASATGWGGAPGGATNVAGGGSAGGSSYRGGPGGGSGGPVTSGDAANNGGTGGSNVGQNGGGGAGGTGGAAGTSGSATPTVNGPDVGAGGGGASITAAAGSGGAGGRCAGGGGGGGALNGNNSGAGGAGGDGLCRIWYS